MILTKNGNLMKFASGAAVNAIIPPDPLNPLGLPPFTIRCKFKSGYTPNMGDSQTLVDADENVWDIYKNSTNWDGLFSGNTSIIEVLGANSTGVITLGHYISGANRSGIFSNCSNLVKVNLFDTSAVNDMSCVFLSTKITTFPTFDTSNVTKMAGTFWLTKADSLPIFDTRKVVSFEKFCYNSSSLTVVPLLDTSSCTNMNDMFGYCTKVQSGALALYQQASTQATVPSHSGTFSQCGKNTVTGAAELAQIPSSWGGTAS